MRILPPSFVILFAFSSAFAEVRFEKLVDTEERFGANEVSNFEVLNGNIYFQATGPFPGQLDSIWKYDGQAFSQVATREDFGLHPDFGFAQIVDSTVFDGKLYYQFFHDHKDAERRLLGLWESDGTYVAQVSDKGSTFKYDALESRFAELDDQLYFVGQQQLWKTDGTSVVLANDGSTVGEHLVVFDGDLYFQGTDPELGNALRKFDGLNETTVADLVPDSPEGSTTAIAAHDGILFKAGTTGAVKSLKYDGTNLIVLDRLPWPSTDFVSHAGSHYLVDGAGDLWKYDGSAFSEVGEGPSPDPQIVLLHGDLYMGKTDDFMQTTRGSRLWHVNTDDEAIDTIAFDENWTGNARLHGVFNDVMYFSIRSESVELWRAFEVTPADFNANGRLDADDIDLLSLELRGGGQNTAFDLNGDSQVTAADRQAWVQDAAHTMFGDANLDRSVGFPDFVALANGYGAGGGWAAGDFDGDGLVGFPDFVMLNENFGRVANSQSAAQVPEPISTVWLFAYVLTATLRRAYYAANRLTTCRQAR